MKKGFTLLAAILTLFGCNTQKKSDSDAETKKSKYLVVYYSQTGATQSVAQEISQLLGADTLRIDAAQPYNGTYDATIERCKKEMANNELPQLKAIDVDWTKYDTIFIGYPIWFGTYALPVATLLDEVDFAGKKLVPFCTYGSGGLHSSVKDLKQTQPKAEILKGYGVRNARLAKAPAEIKRFLIENGYIAGEVETLPVYSDQQPVTEEEVALFNAACGDYKYPLGTPVTVDKRVTSQSTDYRFVAQSTDVQGNTTEATIYVTVENGGIPEFTEVVR